MIILKADELENFNNEKGTSVTIGKFDGVHLGHRALIEETVRYAGFAGLLSCVVTFNNAAVFLGDKDKKVLTTIEEKSILFERAGVDVMVVLEFTDVLRNMLPKEFIDFFLVNMLNVSSVTIGSDFYFGRNRQGSVRDFTDAQMEYGFNVTVLDKEKFEGEEISSTRIRECIKKGELNKANSLLGYDYMIAGKTESGKKKGRQIGAPTLNLYPLPEKLVPPLGVYASKGILEGKEYNAVTNIGVCPTVIENKEISVETHLINYSSDREMYGEQFEVHLCDFIREEKKFDSVEDLYARIQEDVKEAEKILAK